ncbi:hypothetical protein ANANG_G00086470 [Anguilla anguilla]|uniref:Secreted protein n=1 Tax=Anguilla anguilla TaxID=7936 RepID=A0A9D3MKZ9_ANGAN|nr:hypothetical protein ANANG_G00086470 [Anguilla anguilla]
MICLSFITLLLASRELGLLGLSPPPPPPPPPPPDRDLPPWLLSWWWSPPPESGLPSSLSRSRRAWYSACLCLSSSSRFLRCCCWKCCWACRSCLCGGCRDTRAQAHAQLRHITPQLHPPSKSYFYIKRKLAPARKLTHKFSD